MSGSRTVLAATMLATAVALGTRCGAEFAFIDAVHVNVPHDTQNRMRSGSLVEFPLRCGRCSMARFSTPTTCSCYRQMVA
jgi:hypothetical protein